MRLPAAILIACCLCLGVQATTNEPPMPVSSAVEMPPWSPTPDSVEGIELQRQIDELEVYAESLRPSPRVLMSDGRIITWSNEAIEWHIEVPLFKVEWREHLIGGEWGPVGFRSGNKLSHRKAEGFYRVTRIARPTLPPEHPPKRRPNPPPARTDANTAMNRNYGGFRK